MLKKSLNRSRTVDSALSYYVNQLEAFDPTLYKPLTNITWGRDIKLRTDLTFGNEASSFIRQQFGGVGTLTRAVVTSLGSAQKRRLFQACRSTAKRFLPRSAWQHGK